MSEKNEFLNNLKKIKNSNTPLFTIQNDIKNFIVDNDHFPYSRNYRGNPTSNIPIINKRECGYRKILSQCYKPVKTITEIKNNYPQHCFETSCTINKPCYQKENDKFKSFNKLNNLVNDSCIINER